MKILYDLDNIYLIESNIKYIEDYINMFNSPYYYNNFEIKHKDKTKNDIIKWIENTKNKHQYTIITKDTNDFLGICGFNETNSFNEEIYINIIPKFQNQKYGNKILEKLIYIGFNEIKLNRIECCIFSTNERSIHLCKKYGFKEYKKIKIENKNNIYDIYLELKELR